MKAQAEAYMDFTYGEFDDDLKKICKDLEIKRYSRNYTGALRCVTAKQEAREQQAYHKEQQERQEAKEERLQKKADYALCIKNGYSEKFCRKKLH